MATRNIVPRATGEGSLGTETKKWGNIYADNLHSSNPLPIANGGTGATTVAGARNALGLGNTTGALPIANGGTGATTVAGARNALGLGNTTGALPIANGGTGASTAEQARTNLGLGNVATLNTVPIANGGTGATTASDARTNLGLGSVATLNTVPIANGGTGATTAKQARANLEVEPIGTIFAFAGNDIPAGYLPCNGSAINRETYADLFAIIGTTYGSGDGSTTFNLPNLTDKFIQGSDTAGTVKSAGLPDITGEVTIWSCTANSDVALPMSGALNVSRNGNNASALNQTMGGDIIINIDASRSSSIYGNSDTVQPPALTMRYIIKY